MVKILQLAKEGKHGASGTPLTREDIQQIVETFHPDDVPVVIGHQWSDSAPAYGRIKAVWAEEINGELYLLGRVDLLDELKEYWDLGIYNRWSIGIAKNAEGKTYLHHLALLGAVPPKIKGLKELSVQYSDNITTIEFGESPKYKSFAKTGYPIADPDTSWDAEGAKKRIVQKYGWAKLKECVGAVDVSSSDTPESYSAYKFPFCDVIDGQIKIVPKAVSSGIAYLNGARGVSIPENLAKVVKPIFEKLKERIDKTKNYSDGGNDMDEKLKELQQKYEALQREKEELEKRMKFADQLEKELKKTKIENLKKAAEGKIPKEKLDLLLEFAEKAKFEPVEFSDNVQRDIYDLLKEIFETLPTPVKQGEEFKFSDKDEPTSFVNDIAQNM